MCKLTPSLAPTPPLFMSVRLDFRQQQLPAWVRHVWWRCLCGCPGRQKSLLLHKPTLPADLSRGTAYWLGDSIFFLGAIALFAILW